MFVWQYYLSNGIIFILKKWLRKKHDYIAFLNYLHCKGTQTQKNLK